METLDENYLGLVGSTEGSYDVVYGFPKPLRIFTTVMAFVFAILGFVGNFLTIVALLRYPKVRNVTAAFILSLCLANLAFCILVLPFDAMRFVDPSWTESRALCVLVPFFRYANIGVSLMSIAAITINRYIMIAHHSVYARIYKKHWIACMIGFCWIFSYGVLLPPLFEIWGRFDRDRSMDTCTIVKDPGGRSPKIFLFIIGFLIPTVFIVACYTRIFWVVNRSEKKMRQHGALPPRIKSPHEPRNFAREAKRKRTEWRILKMVLAIFLSFLLCQLPITLIKIIDPDFKRPGFHLVGYLLVYLSVCVNPIIYGVMNEQYRKAYAGVICCSKMRTNTTTPQGSSAAPTGTHQQRYYPRGNPNCANNNYGQGFSKDLSSTMTSDVIMSTLTR